MNHFDLSQQWHTLTAPLLPDYTRREAELAKLLAAYGAPGRHYHNLHHIRNFLTQVADN